MISDLPARIALSRRVAAAKNRARGELSPQQQVELARATETAAKFDDLPEWVRDLVVRTEAG